MTTTLEAIESISGRSFTWHDGCEAAKAADISLEELADYLKTDIRFLPIDAAFVLCQSQGISVNDIVAAYID